MSVNEVIDYVTGARSWEDVNGDDVDIDYGFDYRGRPLDFDREYTVYDDIWALLF